MPIPSVCGPRALHDGMAWKEYMMALSTAVIELTCVANDVVRLLRAPQSGGTRVTCVRTTATDAAHAGGNTSFLKPGARARTRNWQRTLRSVQWSFPCRAIEICHIELRVALECASRFPMQLETLSGPGSYYPHSTAVPTRRKPREGPQLLSLANCLLEHTLHRMPTCAR